MPIWGSILIVFLILLSVGMGVFVFFYVKRAKERLKEQEEGNSRRLYEASILRELGERIGYSLNVQKIIDIITGSLRQFIEYGAVSYMLIEPEKIIFKVHLEESVSRKFIDDVRDRMLKSLSALLDKEFKKNQVEEILSGAILVEELEEPVRSFFNIPLAIGEKVVGVLTVAHTKVGLYKEEEMTILYKITKQASDAVTSLEEVVRTEQRKLNAMVESMAEGVIMTDKDYRIMVVNPAAKRAVGLQDKEEVSIFDFIDRLEGKFAIKGRLEESVKLDKALVSDEVLLGERFFKIFVSPVKSSTGMTKGEILGGVVIFHEITHDKEVEKMKEDFTAMMVHELRSPLDAIRNIAKLLQKEDIKKDEKTYTESVQMIYSSSSNILELVSDMLDVAKVESGKFSIESILEDIKATIHEGMGRFEALAKSKEIKLVTSLVADFPKIEFDKKRVSQALDNLISNALKFTDSGGRVTVQAFLHKKGGDLNQEAGEVNMEWIDSNRGSSNDIPDSVVVAVTDTGYGIPEKQLGKIFSKFQQLEAARRTEKRGTGLGLAIVKGIVETHGGVVGVGSIEGRGSTFYFTLPINSKGKKKNYENTNR